MPESHRNTPTAPTPSPLRNLPRRRLVMIGAALSLAVALGLGYRMASRPADANVMSALVTKGDIEDTVLATGILKPVKLVAVGAQVSGRINSVNVKLGQLVEKGELLAEIDSLTQQNDLLTAQATLAAKRAERVEKAATLAYAKSVLARNERTLARKASSRDDYESALATVKTTQAQITALDADIKAAAVAVETARIDLGYTKIKAPISGTVLAIVSQEGQTVNAVQSAPTIVILGQLDVMTIRAEISEADVVKTKPGQKAYFTILGGPDERYDATLESIEPAPESITSDSSFSTSTTSSTSSSSTSSSEAIYYNGILHVPNADGHLRTYMTAEVHIILGQAHDVLTIPSSALGSRDKTGRYSVRVIDGDGVISARAVEVGLNNKVSAEIRSGLKAGERVVIGQLSAQTDSTSRGPGGPPGMF